MTVTKKEIVKRISERKGLTQLDTKEIVQMVLDEITETLVNEGRIELRNFGVFEVKVRAARKARNPRTNKAVYVPAKKIVTFKPGKTMQDRVQQAQLEDDKPAPGGDAKPTPPAASTGPVPVTPPVQHEPSYS